MTAYPATWPGRPAELDDEIKQSLSLVRADATAVILYGSRARRTHRADSDVDILAIISTSPGTFQQGKTSITYYTEAHLCALAQNGSLFVRHLREEGVVISDRTGAFDRVSRSFNLSGANDVLRSEVAIVLAALNVSDRDAYSSGLARAGAWAARTALYLELQARNELTYDLHEACGRVGRPDLVKLIYAAREGQADLDQLMIASEGLIEARASCDTDLTLADFTLAAWTKYRVAPKILESVIAGEATLAYTELTLPPG